jgi:predicted NUDIX family NTP pyrophosphohydrolase
VLLAHPGGPYWRNRDLGAWTIPKGEIDAGEDPFAAAKREFTEETGLVAEGRCMPLTPLRQPGGKTVMAWALEGDGDADRITSNTFAMEWPPKSGTLREFPEIDQAAWFAFPQAREKILRGQAAFLDELEMLLSKSVGSGNP